VIIEQLSKAERKMNCSEWWKNEVPKQLEKISTLFLSVFVCSRSQQKEKQQGSSSINDNSYIRSFHSIEVQKAKYLAVVCLFEEHVIL